MHVAPRLTVRHTTEAAQARQIPDVCHLTVTQGAENPLVGQSIHVLIPSFSMTCLQNLAVLSCTHVCQTDRFALASPFQTVECYWISDVSESGQAAAHLTSIFNALPHSSSEGCRCSACASCFFTRSMNNRSLVIIVSSFSSTALSNDPAVARCDTVRKMSLEEYDA